MTVTTNTRPIATTQRTTMPQPPNVVIEPTVFPKHPKLARSGNVQPFPYQGSKRALASAIIPLMGESVRVVEPFAGSAAISIAARLTGISHSGIIADVNEPLMNLWQAIIDEPENLADDYEALWIEQHEDPRAFFNLVRDRFNDTHQPADLLYLLNRIVKGAVRYGRNGRMNQGADHRRLGAKPATVRARIMGASQLMQGTEVIAAPYEQVLSKVDPATDVVYMDPPYQGTSTSPDHRYIANLQREPFENELRKLVENDVRFIVSYDIITDDAKYGDPLDESLGLKHLHVAAGTSAQATLLGRKQPSIESLYLSPALAENLDTDRLTVDTLF